MKKSILFLVSFLVLFAGCKKENVVNEPLDFGYQYFPLRIGDSAIFEVNHIFWNDFDNTIDTTHYFLCEYFESSTTNLTGDTLYRIERLLKNREWDSWRIDSVWFSLRSNNEAIRVENNYSYVKMVFPLSVDVSWNGNAHNPLRKRPHECVKIEPASVNGIYYSSVAYIDLERDTSLIHSNVETEMYARNVGLIRLSKEHVYKEFNPLTNAFEIRSGYQMVQTRVH